MAIPAHLVKIYKLDRSIDDMMSDFKTHGSIICECKNLNFYVYKTKEMASKDYLEYLEALKTIGNKYKTQLGPNEMFFIVNIKGRTFLGSETIGVENKRIYEDITEIQKKLKESSIPTVVKLKCAVCGKEYEIFNSSKHGYDGIISNKKYEGKIPMTKKRRCSSCNGETYQVELTISNTGKKDLMEEGGEYITEENWTTAFEWISVDLSCSTCGKKYKKWFDMETM